jgi:hypothetical protein
MMLCILWLYTVWAMIAFVNQSWEDPNIDCHRLYDCFIYVTNLGLRNSGGIGDHFTVTKPSDALFYTRSLFELTFYMIINVVFLNVIFGIILDTFSQLRNDAEIRLNDEKELCFVCGYTRSEFTRIGKDFDIHVQDHHNPWKYVYYIYYLKEKGYTELTGLETICYDNYTKKKTEWLPIGKTLYLSEGDNEDHAGTFYFVKSQ